jgi:hypothetical protein
MKAKILLIVAALAIVVVGCVRTVSGKRTAAVPLVKDRVEGRYERPASQVFEAAKEVIRLNGALASEGTLHSGTNAGGVLVLEGRVNQRKVWVSVEQIDPKISSVIVQARTKAGGKDIELCHELEKQVALKLVVAR